MVSTELRRRVDAELPNWTVEGNELVGTWRFDDFGGALAAAVTAGMLAERANHHPDLMVGWGRLVVRLTTHDAGGLTVRDLDLALQIEGRLGPPSA
jgi:4a-hydroxytetrahydrobiopterin dehydratase